MLSISGLMEAVDNVGRGYRGGYIARRDYFPYATLDESCVMMNTALTDVLCEMAMDDDRTTTLISEATISIMTGYGNSRSIGVILEASLKGLWARIKKFFENAIKWVKSIATKISAEFSTLGKKHADAWSKYGSKIRDDIDKADLVFNGYKVTRGKPYVDKIIKSLGSSKDYKLIISSAVTSVVSGLTIEAPDDYITTVKTALKGVTGGAAGEAYGELSAATKAKYEGLINKLPKNDNKAFAAALAKAFIGTDNSFDFTSNDWASNFKSKLYGDKVDIKYGTDMFNKSDVEEWLTKDFDEKHTGVSDAVDTLDTALNTAKGEFEEAQSNLSDTLGAGLSESAYRWVINEDEGVEVVEKDNDGSDDKPGKADAAITAPQPGGGGGGTGNNTPAANPSDNKVNTTTLNTIVGYVNSYFSWYINALNAVININTSLLNIAMDYYKTMAKQAHAMLAKMVSWRPSKENSSYDFEFDF